MISIALCSVTYSFGTVACMSLNKAFKGVRPIIAVFNAIPKDYHPASTVAANLGRSEQDVSKILEAMAVKGLVLAGGIRWHIFLRNYTVGQYP